MIKEKIPQLVITVLVLAGFASFVLIYMFLDMTEKNSEVLKIIITGAGANVSFVLGYWFGSK
jgi:hypothetical protein